MLAIEPDTGAMTGYTISATGYGGIGGAHFLTASFDGTSAWLAPYNSGGAIEITSGFAPTVTAAIPAPPAPTLVPITAPPATTPVPAAPHQNGGQ